MQRILLTGASGGIGGRLRKLLPTHYPQLRLSDLTAPQDLRAEEEFVVADLADESELDRALGQLGRQLVAPALDEELR